jgi:hypothetical protein
MGKIKEDLRPLGAPQSWARTPGTYISGQAAIDGADHAAVMMELKWGAGRLRLLVPTELREKFDRQRYLLNQATWHGDLEAVRREGERMAKAWMALDRAAEAAGEPKLDPLVWEATLADGTAVAIVRNGEDARAVKAGRRIVTYTMDEICHMLDVYQATTKVKEVWPGATVEKVRRTISDPLDTLVDSDIGLDDPIPSFEFGS